MHKTLLNPHSGPLNDPCPCPANNTSPNNLIIFFAICFQHIQFPCLPNHLRGKCKSLLMSVFIFFLIPHFLSIGIVLSLASFQSNYPLSFIFDSTRHQTTCPFSRSTDAATDNAAREYSFQFGHQG